MKARSQIKFSCLTSRALGTRRILRSGPQDDLLGRCQSHSYTRAARHGGNVEAVSKTAPADLYSNSTVALNMDAVVTGLGQITANLFTQAGITPQRNNAIYAFALPN